MKILSLKEINEAQAEILRLMQARITGRDRTHD